MTLCLTTYNKSHEKKSDETVAPPPGDIREGGNTGTVVTLTVDVCIFSKKNRTTNE